MKIIENSANREGFSTYAIETLNSFRRSLGLFYMIFVVVANNSLMGGRDLLSCTSSMPDSWRRPMAFGGLANPSPSTQQLNGQSSSNSASPEKDRDRKEGNEKKENNTDSREKRTLDDRERDHDRDRESSSSAKRSKRTESSQHGRSPSMEKRESPKDSDSRRLTSPPRDRERENRKHDTTGHTSKAIDLRHRSESSSISAAPERTKSVNLTSVSSQSAIQSSAPSFAGAGVSGSDSPFPSFLAPPPPPHAGFDRGAGGMFSSIPVSMAGFPMPGLWSGLDVNRSMSSEMARDMFWRTRSPPDLFRMSAGMGGMGMNTGGNPYLERERLEREFMRMKGINSSFPAPGGGGGHPLFPPQMPPGFLRNPFPDNMYAPSHHVLSNDRPSPTPTKTGHPVDSGSPGSRKESTQNGKESPAPTDLSKSRSSSSQPQQSQSGKDSSSASNLTASASGVTLASSGGSSSKSLSSSSKGHHRDKDRDRDNAPSKSAVEKEKS